MSLSGKVQNDGIGIQLSILRSLVRKYSEKKLFFVFEEDIPGFVIEMKNEQIDVKEGDSFFKREDDDTYFIETYNMYFSESDLAGHEGKFKPKTPSEYTIQDVSDLIRFHIRSQYGTDDALVNTSSLYAFNKSEPFKCSYVICPRSVFYNELVAALYRHVQQKKIYVDENDYFVWIDIFCTSLFQSKQRNNTTEEEDDEFIRETSVQMRERSSLFSETLIYFDSIEKPKALQRLWCIWELYLGSQASETTPLSILFASKLSISSAVLKDFDNLLEGVMGLDPYALKSSNSQASKIIFKLLTEVEEGFLQVIETIKMTLCLWLTNLVIREYENSFNESIIHVTELYLDVGLFLVNIKHASKYARMCLKRAKGILEDKSLEVYFKTNNYEARLLCKAKSILLNDKILLLKNPSFISRMGVFQGVFLEYKSAVKYNEAYVNLLLGNHLARTKKNKSKSYEEVDTDTEVYKSDGKVAHFKEKKKKQKPGHYLLRESLSRGSSIQSTLTMQESGKFLAKSGANTRHLEAIVIDLQLHYYTAQQDYRAASRAMHLILRNKKIKHHNLFGGFSKSTLNFKFAEMIFTNRETGNQNELIFAQQEFERALILAKSGKINQSRFMYEKCAYYLALSWTLTNSASVYGTLREHFFSRNKISMKDLNLDEPFVIGCTRRAAQVFFLLHEHAPSRVKAKVKDLFYEIGSKICVSLFGSQEKNFMNMSFGQFVDSLQPNLRVFDESSFKLSRLNV